MSAAHVWREELHGSDVRHLLEVAGRVVAAVFRSGDGWVGFAAGWDVRGESPEACRRAVDEILAVGM